MRSTAVQVQAIAHHACLAHAVCIIGCQDSISTWKKDAQGVAAQQVHCLAMPRVSFVIAQGTAMFTQTIPCPSSEPAAASSCHHQ